MEIRSLIPPLNAPLQQIEVTDQIFAAESCVRLIVIRKPELNGSSLLYFRTEGRLSLLHAGCRSGADPRDGMENREKIDITIHI